MTLGQLDHNLFTGDGDTEEFDVMGIHAKEKEKFLKFYSNACKCKLPDVDKPCSTVDFNELFLFLVKDMQSIEKTMVRGHNMQIYHPLRCQQINMSMAERLISIFWNIAGTPLTTFQSDAVVLEYYSTSWNFVLFDTLHQL